MNLLFSFQLLLLLLLLLLLPLLTITVLVCLLFDGRCRNHDIQHIFLFILNVISFFVVGLFSSLCLFSSSLESVQSDLIYSSYYIYIYIYTYVILLSCTYKLLPPCTVFAHSMCAYILPNEKNSSYGHFPSSSVPKLFLPIFYLLILISLFLLNRKHNAHTHTHTHRERERERERERARELT